MQTINQIPKSIQSEKCLLGYLLSRGRKGIVQVIDKIKSADFWDLSNQNIYNQIEKEYKKNAEITIISIKEKLKVKATYLAELVNSHYLESEIDGYIKEIKRTSNLRQLIQAGVKIQQLGLEENISLDDILKQTNKLLVSIATDKESRLKRMEQMLMESMQRLDDRANNRGIVGVPTGFYDIDNILHGFKKGTMNVLAARPSVGKTSLAMNIAVNTAKKKNNVLIFSLEQSTEELIDKIICSEGNISLWKMQSGYIDDSMTEGYNRGIASVADLNIIIDDNGIITPAHIIQTIEKIQQEEKIDLIIIDYLQLMKSGLKTISKYEEVSNISNQIKIIAKTYQLPILALAQLNREVEKRDKDSMPRLSDLRDSGAIEADADVIMFLKRDVMSKEVLHDVQIGIAKHRAGPVGIIDLLYEPKTTNFKNKSHALSIF